MVGYWNTDRTEQTLLLPSAASRERRGRADNCGMRRMHRYHEPGLQRLPGFDRSAAYQKNCLGSERPPPSTRSHRTSLVADRQRPFDYVETPGIAEIPAERNNYDDNLSLSGSLMYPGRQRPLPVLCLCRVVRGVAGHRPERQELWLPLEGKLYETGISTNFSMVTSAWRCSIWSRPTRSSLPAPASRPRLAK